MQAKTPAWAKEETGNRPELPAILTESGSGRAAAVLSALLLLAEFTDSKVDIIDVLRVAQFIDHAKGVH